MEEKNIISTEEAQKVAENAVETTKNSNKGFKTFGVIGSVAGVAAIVYFGVKYGLKKIKEKKSKDDDNEVTAVEVEETKTEE